MAGLARAPGPASAVRKAPGPASAVQKAPGPARPAPRFPKSAGAEIFDKIPFSGIVEKNAYIQGFELADFNASKMVVVTAVSSSE